MHRQLCYWGIFEPSLEVASSYFAYKANTSLHMLRGHKPTCQITSCRAEGGTRTHVVLMEIVYKTIAVATEPHQPNVLPKLFCDKFLWILSPKHLVGCLSIFLQDSVYMVKPMPVPNVVDNVVPPPIDKVEAEFKDMEIKFLICL